MKKVHYAKLPTEKPNPRSRNIDVLPVERILEIMNQEDASVPRAVAGVKKNIAQAVKLIIARLKKGGRIFFAGAGTSGRLGILEAAECPPTFNTSPSLVQAVIAGGKKAVFRSLEGAEDNRKEGYRIFSRKITGKDVLVGIAASGVTPFVAGALQAAKTKKAAAVLIACNSAPPFKNLADCLISPRTGPEVITGSTRLKAGTATKLILNMLTVASMVQLGKVYQNWMVDLQPKSKKLRARAIRLIERLGQVSPQEAVNYFERARKNAKPAILMARKGLNYSQALKKLKTAAGFLRTALTNV